MNKKNQKFSILIGMAALVVVGAFLLTSCSEKPSEVPDDTSGTNPAVTTEEVTSGDTTTAAEDETTAQTTEATVAETEEVTVPEETEAPTTEPTTGGNPTPGGNSGYYPGGSGSGGSSDEEEPAEKPEEEEVVISAPGAQDNPYTESVSQLPDAITTVKIPVDSTIYYDVYGVGGLILTVEDPDAYIVYNEKTYHADENGLVTVELAEN